MVWVVFEGIIVVGSMWLEVWWEGSEGLGKGWC